MIRLLRVASFTEGVSYLLLLLVAMPLKYHWHIPTAFQFAGWAHGGLFVTLFGLTVLAMWRSALPFRTACAIGLASVLPAGPFFVDSMLKRHQRDSIAIAKNRCR